MSTTQETRLGRPPEQVEPVPSEPVNSVATVFDATVYNPDMTVVRITRQPIEAIDFYKGKP